MSRKSLSHSVTPILVALVAAACSSGGSGSSGGEGGAGSSGSGGLGGSTVASAGSSGTASSSKAGASSGGSSAMAGSSSMAGSSALGGSTSEVQSSAKGGTSTGTTTQVSSSAKGGGGATTGGTTGGTTTATGGTATGGRSGADAGVDRDAGSGGGTGGRSNPDASPSTGGSGGSIGASPCKASPCVILPLGDSITHGFGSSDDAGYRSGLFKLAVAANQNITFIGSLSNGNVPAVSGKTFPKNHEGHDGFKVTQINDYVPPKKAFSTTPHIVLLHAGTNDMTSNANPTTTADQLKTLVGNIVAAAPDALVVVAKIVPLGYNNSNYTSYIAKIPDVVKTYADKGQNVIMVDMSTLPGSDIKGSGDVHPTAKGYSDMADLWYGAIKGYLPN